MDLRSLNIFIEVAELGSFTRAGEKLGYSQPTVSFQIKQLERELGARLFDRIGHTVTLTDAGRDALVYAQQICQNMQEMALAADERREPAGMIRLGMADSLCGPLIAGQFSRFREKYPKVSLKILTGGTPDLFWLLDHNEVDLICTMDRYVYDTTYVIAAEEKVDVHFVVSSRNPLAKRSEIGVGELLQHPFLLTEKGVSYGRILDEVLARNSMEVQPVLSISSTDLLCGLVEQDAGISFLPDYVTDAAVARGTIRRLNVPEVQVSVWKQILYRRDKWVSLQMRAMIEHLSRILLKN